MSEIKANVPLQPGLPGLRVFAGRESQTGMIVLFSVAAAVAIAAMSLLARDSGEPLVLLVMSCLAIAGVFFLFAASAGLVRIAGAEDDYRALIDLLETVPEGLRLTRANGSVLYSNRAFDTLMEDGSPGGLSAWLADPSISRETMLRLELAASGRRPWAETVELPGAAGNPRRMSLSVAPVTDALGLPLTAWRIAPVVAIEEAATGPHPGTLAALDAVPASLFLAANGRIAFVNAALCDLIGVDPADQDAASQRLSGVIGSLASRLAGATLPSHPGEAASLDVDLPARPGELPALRLSVRPLPGETGVGLGLLVPREASAAPVAGQISDVDRRFARYFNASPIAIATLDREGRIGRANAAFDRMFGATPLNGRPGARSLPDLSSPDSRADVRAAILRAADSKEVASLEFKFGSEAKHFGRLYLSSIGAGAGERDQVVIYAIDATEQKELEMQVAQSQKMQAVGQLAGGIAHDFNNVLTVIIGFSDLLLANHRPTDPAFRDINAIKQNANRAAGLVRQLLAHARLQTLRPEVLSLTDIISDFKETFARVIGEKVKLTVRHGRDLWPVKADATQLNQVIMNLAVNARDAMPDGGSITIRTANLSAAEVSKLTDRGLETGDYVLCEVVDTGSGMTPEVKAKIFEPFFSTKEVGKGTGLGLSTVYGIIKQTGGYIYCDSELGKGTAFRIYLPRHLQDAPEQPQAVQRAERKERTRDLTGTGTVLLVEDEEAVRRFAVRALTRQGFEVLEAGTGAEALEVMDAHTGAVDLVVSDIVMPEMDGPTLLKELRKRNPETKIIFISGYAEDALKSLDGDEEFQFLPKPFQMADLVAAVKETMGS